MYKGKPYIQQFYNHLNYLGFRSSTPSIDTEWINSLQGIMTDPANPSDLHWQYPARITPQIFGCSKIRRLKESLLSADSFTDIKKSLYNDCLKIIKRIRLNCSHME